MVILNQALFEIAESITYCVKPKKSNQCLFDDCRNQPCKSWSYYVDYIDELVNQQTNVTIIFMNGIHEARYSVNILSPDITIVGESQKATVQGFFAIYFVNNIQVTIKSITFENTYISVSPSESLEIHVQFESVNLTYSTVHAYIEVNADLLMQFTLCKFYNGTSLFGDMKVNFSDCELVNNSMILAGAALQISGVSKISNALRSAITCYFVPLCYREPFHL